MSTAEPWIWSLHNWQIEYIIDPLNFLVAKSDLRHPTIGIFHTTCETRAALEVRDMYVKLGARVQLRIVTPEPEPCREVQYFDYENPKLRSIATVMARGLRRYGETTVSLVHLRKPEFDFVVVLRREIQFSLCPKCKCKVRVDRLKRHLQKPHLLVVLKKKKPKKKIVVLASPEKERKRPKKLIFASSSPLPPSVMGKPEHLGWTWTSANVRVKKLKPRTGVRRCRICGAKPVMYNSQECYSCNPK